MIGYNVEKNCHTVQVKNVSVQAKNVLGDFSVRHYQPTKIFCVSLVINHAIKIWNVCVCKHFSVEDWVCERYTYNDWSQSFIGKRAWIWLMFVVSCNPRRPVWYLSGMWWDVSCGLIRVSHDLIGVLVSCKTWYDWCLFWVVSYDLIDVYSEL